MSGEIPSSSPVYTPIKRRKYIDLGPMTGETLFGNRPLTAPPLRTTNPASQYVPGTQREDAFASDDEEHSGLFDSVALSQESIKSSVDLTGATDHGWDDEEPSAEPQTIPNSQWWENEKLPPPLDVSAADETIDTDSDSEGPGLSTQKYLKDILTESMVESLPLPPPQKRQVMTIYRQSRPAASDLD